MLWIWMFPLLVVLGVAQSTEPLTDLGKSSSISNELFVRTKCVLTKILLL